MSDIRFVGDNVHAEGSVLKVTCFDVELDNAGRRRSGGTIVARSFTTSRTASHSTGTVTTRVA